MVILAHMVMVQKESKLFGAFFVFPVLIIKNREIMLLLGCFVNITFLSPCQTIKYAVHIQNDLECLVSVFGGVPVLAGI